MIKRPLAWTLNRSRDLRNSRRRTVEKVALANDRAAFEEIYGSEPLRREYLGAERLAFYEAVAVRCAAFDPRSVIDVGCGTGTFLAMLASRCPALTRVVGVDQAAAGIAELRRLLPDAEGLISDVYEFDLPVGAFDLVVCMEVLEHLEDPNRVLRRLGQLCARDGHVVVTVPDGEVDTYAGHRNFWSAAEFEALLGGIGNVAVDRIGTTLVGTVAAQDVSESCE